MTTYSIQGYYGSQYKWEEVCQEDTKAEARKRLAEYRENEPEYRHRIVQRREKVNMITCAWCGNKVSDMEVCKCATE